VTFRVVSCLVGLLLLSTLLSAQATRKSTSNSIRNDSKLISISVTGSRRYRSEELVPATGLQLGNRAAEEDLKAAAQRLGETGLFSEVTFSYSFASEGTKAEFQVSDSDQLLPVRFDNFVWFTDAELIAKVQAHAPLFKGQVPADGDLLTQVADVIAALVVDLNPQLHGDYIRSSPSVGAPVDMVVFSVTGAQIHTRNFEFPGASPSQAPALGRVSQKFSGREYLRSALSQVARLDLLPIYLKQGYLKASFADAQAQVVSNSPQETIVDVKMPVEEGHQYKLTTVGWSGNAVFPTDKLQPLIHAKPDEPADAVLLSEDLDVVKKLYGTRGYVGVSLDPKPVFNDGAYTVAFNIEVREGEMYRMGDFDVEGLDAKATTRLKEDWRLREGEPYDAGYPSRYLEESKRDVPKGGQWSISVDETRNDKDKTVDVTVRFLPASPH
jgi:outer membrane protein assembly factor BamA